MAKSALFDAMKSNGYLIGPLDNYLFTQANKPNDRAINVNAPSCIGKCMRANYYMRMQYDRDGVMEPRTQRIFDNGDGMHERIQGYLTKMGILICDEVPLINDEHNIQGHTDGLLELSDEEVAILELKSINDRGFSALKGPKDEHRKQGLTYLFCAETRRRYLRSKYSTPGEFYASQPEREKYFRSHYQHMKDGSKWTRKQKIENEVKLNLICDDILFFTEKEVSKVIFLYENKNDQSLKEYTVEMNKENEKILKEVLAECDELDSYCAKKKVPPRCGESKSCQACRFCDFKDECWR